MHTDDARILVVEDDRRSPPASLTVHRAAGNDDCILEIPRWDFSWQGNYQLRAPLTLHAGDRLELTCTSNNAAGAAAVGWGEGTGDEMCLGVIHVTAA